MTTPRETKTFIEQELAEPLERIERARLSAVRELQRKRRHLKIGAVVLTLLLMFIMGPFGLFVGIVVGFFGYLGFSQRFQNMAIPKALRDDFKRDVIRPLVHHAAPSTTYHPDRHVPLDAFSASGMFQTHPTRFRGDDLVEGRLGDTDIRFSELDAEHRGGSSEGGDSRTIFKGLFFSADFHKDFRGFTIVRPRPPKLVKSYLGRGSKADKMNAGLAMTEHMMGSRWTPERSRFGRLEEIELEDPEFMEHFRVYSTDQVEARYILSPSMMERLLAFRREAVRAREALTQRLEAKKKFIQVVDQDEMESGRFYVSFAHSNVYIAKHHFRDLFEIDTRHPLTDPSRIEEYAADLRFAFDIVEDLNLNTRIWKG